MRASAAAGRDNSRLSNRDQHRLASVDSIRALVTAAREHRPLLAVGCVSPTSIAATLRVAGALGTPAILVASRNQIEEPTIGRGYAAPFSAQPLVGAVRAAQRELHTSVPVFVCRDHGGPWQRYDERLARLPAGTALARARSSLEADIRAGLRYVHVDMSAAHGALTREQMVDATVALIEACENVRLNTDPSVEYEVSTEHADGGISTTTDIDAFLEPLLATLDIRGLPKPTTVVIRCGTVCHEGRNAGVFDGETAAQLADHVHAKFDLLVKEHNGDYLPVEELGQHARSGIDLINIGPSVGDAETTAMLHLADLEVARIPAAKQSHFRQHLRAAIQAAAPVHIWHSHSQVVEPLSRDLILRTCGHYVANEARVARAREALFANCAMLELPDDPREIVAHRVEEVIAAIIRGLGTAVSTPPTGERADA